jgi:Ca2+-binding RTX toxin-like protein
MSSIESLEPRRLMAATVSLTSRGTLLVEGTEANDNVAITAHGKFYDVQIVTGFTLGEDGRTTFTSETERFAAKDVRRIYADLGVNNDRIGLGIGVDKPTVLLGGPGEDILQTRNTRSILSGGDGDDLLSCKPYAVRNRFGAPSSVRAESASAIFGSANNQYLGGPGNDRIQVFAGGGFVDGGSGRDRLIAARAGIQTTTEPYDSADAYTFSDERLPVAITNVETSETLLT